MMGTTTTTTTKVTITEQIRLSPDEQKQKQLAILERQQEFPEKLREVIIEQQQSKEEDNNPRVFLRKIETKLIIYLLQGLNNNNNNNNCDRDDEDTEKEVEIAIRFFPNVLSKRDRHGKCPINWQLLRYNNNNSEFNLKAVLFIPFLAKMGIELGEFEEGERGGLISSKWNVLETLATNSKRGDEEHQQLVDETFLAVMEKLRENNSLFKKEDIHEYKLLERLCRQYMFPENRVRYLAEWDPSCLMMPSSNNRFLSCYDGMLPIHHATYNSKDIRGFRTLLGLGMRHFPTEIGFLFRNRRHQQDRCYGHSSYRMACDKYGNEEVSKIVDGILNSIDDIQRNGCRFDTVKALIYAVTEESIHLDGVYILLRREPSVLQAIGPKMRSDNEDSLNKRKLISDSSSKS